MSLRFQVEVGFPRPKNLPYVIVALRPKEKSPGLCGLPVPFSLFAATLLYSFGKAASQPAGQQVNQPASQRCRMTYQARKAQQMTRRVDAEDDEASPCTRSHSEHTAIKTAAAA